MMQQRLELMRDLLSVRGSIYVHLDATVGHYIKAVMDQVFGVESFQREVVWRIGWISGYKSAAKNWIRNHDTILFYVKNPGDFVFNKEYVPYPADYERRGGQKPTGQGYPIEDVWNANPFEFALTGEDSLDSIQIKSFSTEKTGYGTQKNESVLRRIVTASSNPGDLIADFFCGSGTAMAVAEKTGRRWIGCDLGRWAIHVSRKRLLAIDGCKPFEVLNLGKYERQYWQGVTFGEGKTKPRTEQLLYEYLAFVLRLYGAQPVAGMQQLHGKKGKALVHIGAVDAPVTIDEVTQALNECMTLKQPELHVLGWEWEMGLAGPNNDVRKGSPMHEVAKVQGVKLVLLQIPREVMEQQAATKGDVRFFELAYFKVEVRQPKKVSVQLELADFASPNAELVPEDVRSKIKKWSDYVDYWAIDWDFQNDTFMQGWVAYRTRKDRKLVLTSDVHSYDKPGNYRILVKVIDIFGNDSSQAYDVEVK